MPLACHLGAIAIFSSDPRLRAFGNPLSEFTRNELPHLRPPQKATVKATTERRPLISPGTHWGAWNGVGEEKLALRVAGDPSLLTHYFQIQEGELKTKPISDPRMALAVDVAALRAIPALPSEWLISGLVYDVATGLVEIVVPPAPIRSP